MWTDGFPWPLSREVCQEMVKLAYKLMELVALSLGFPADRFHGFFKDQTSYIRLNHYNPCPCPSPRLALGLGRHLSSASFTISWHTSLLSGQGNPSVHIDWILNLSSNHTSNLFFTLKEEAIFCINFSYLLVVFIAWLKTTIHTQSALIWKKEISFRVKPNLI